MDQSNLFVLRRELGDFSAQKACHQNRCGKRTLAPKQVREKKPIAPKKVREKKPIAPKQVREKDISWLLVKSKQCGKLASKASQNRAGGEGSQSSLAREVWWRQYKIRVFRAGIEILPTSFNICDHHRTFLYKNYLEQDDQQETLPDTS